MVVRIGNKTCFAVNNFKNTCCCFPDNVLAVVLAVGGDRHVNGINGYGCHSRSVLYREKTKWKMVGSLEFWKGLGLNE